MESLGCTLKTSIMLHVNSTSMKTHIYTIHNQLSLPAALIQHLAWELPYATGACKKKKKKKEVISRTDNSGILERDHCKGTEARNYTGTFKDLKIAIGIQFWGQIRK